SRAWDGAGRIDGPRGQGAGPARRPRARAVGTADEGGAFAPNRGRPPPVPRGRGAPAAHADLSPPSPRGGRKTCNSTRPAGGHRANAVAPPRRHKRKSDDPPFFPAPISSRGRITTV